MWFTEQTAGKVGRITTAGTITEFSVPGGNSAFPDVITTGPDGNLWFTENLYSPNVGVHKIVRMTTSGVMTEFDVPNSLGDLDGITAGPDGNLWFTGRTRNSIGRITPTGTVTEFFLPAPMSIPVGIVAGPDGNLWFTELRGKIGRITPAGHITEFAVPGTNRVTEGIAVGPDGNLWFTVTNNGNSIGRLTTDGLVTEFPVPTGVIPGEIAAGEDGAMWFTAGRSSIGRITTGVGPSCASSGTTLCLENRRFKVAVDWRKGDGSTGQGHAVPLTDDAGYFWFFNLSNIEVVVKVLDGCSLNERVWVFAAGLTNLGVTLTVTDIETGESRPYVNPVGVAFQPIQDTSAFESCP
jgi:streptogramin lyase